MTEQELRALVRAAIAQHAPAASPGRAVSGPDPRQHSSHALFVLPAGSDTDGPCLIEPAVACNHCGYCKSHGY